MTARSERGRLVRMASFRLAVLGTLLFAISSIIVFALIYSTTASTARRELMPVVVGERNDVLADALDDKQPLRVEINNELSFSNHTYYALQDAQGKQIGGNIPMPADPLQWHALTKFDGIKLPAGVIEIDGIGSRLADGEILFIAENATVFAQQNIYIAYLFAAVFGFMIVLGLLASILIASYSLKRVTAISHVSRYIIAGDLSRRIELYGLDDELDYLTEDLNTMLNTIEQLVQGARQVTNDIAHDLRTPLMRLRGQLVLLQRVSGQASGGEAKGGQAALAADALAACETLIGIFTALLRLAEIEAGAVRGNFEVFDLSALCREVGDSFQPVAEDKAHELSLAVAQRVVFYGDRQLMNQMLVNLVENAIQHCPPGTRMQLRCFTESGAVVVEMADHGQGIAAGLRDSIFGRFKKLDSARVNAGHGLGMALVKAIIALHEGAVYLDDNKPGLIVRVVLPLAPP